MDTKRMRALRKYNDYTQKQIAELLHVAQSTYSDYEHGRANIPVDSLVVLAKLYGVTLDYLVGISEEKGEKEGERP